MINKNIALKNTQAFNRDLWIKNAEKHISYLIEEASKNGEGFIEIPLSSIVIGAENLGECAEMLSSLHNTLIKEGYEDKITPDGVFVITWKM